MAILVQSLLLNYREQLEEMVNEKTQKLKASNQQLLAQTQELSRMATVVADSNDAITIQDLEGNITAWNAGAKKIYGYSKKEALKMNMADLVPEKYKAEALNFVVALKKGELVDSLETKRKTKDGKILDMWMVVTKLIDKDGKLVGVATTERDITNRKQKEEKLKKSNQQLQANEKLLQLANEEFKSFSYSVSHDLRAPLRALDGFSQVLLHDYKNKLDEDGQDSLQRIRNATVKMGGLIDSLLKLSRISQAEMNPKRVNLSDIANNISKNFIKNSPERDAVFVINPDMIVDGDANLLEIVLVNLLGNAWKFTRNEKKTKIEFSAKKDAKSHKTVYSIRDNGAGFNMAYADKLFGAFQRLHTQEEFEGSGIGLATVNRIIQRHKGRIWVESIEDEGTVFYFTL